MACFRLLTLDTPMQVLGTSKAENYSTIGKLKPPSLTQEPGFGPD
ncbi:hypothetical protein FOTG_11499 [Fusarium oxysporum f. sp. vasinfectum 25433]|uniref:Uncharacterized protein n=1 Tax=Fusarium oxysporum f. sp. vasinfectum 25433 TaxID=1089449 RepID=X0L3W2_FUSOX|nr:hypothetical protein FOTG_11499 [Fusarium oxysporum f. sp. vasinfectum 25433]